LADFVKGSSPQLPVERAYLARLGNAFGDSEADVAKLAIVGAGAGMIFDLRVLGRPFMYRAMMDEHC